MGKKTMRGWLRVDCPDCNGSGVIEDIRLLPDGEVGRKYLQCERCMGCGKINQPIRQKEIKYE